MEELTELINGNQIMDINPIPYPEADLCNLFGDEREDALFFYHPDHLGSTGMVTDNSSNITQGFLYAPFGEIITEFNPSWESGRIPKYSFNAKELDEENGMYYYSARYYAPPTFISRDPLFEKYPSISPYTYCANNPMLFVDPTGRDVYKADGEGGFERVRWSIRDKVYSVDKDGNKVNKISFKKGTIQENSQVNEGNNNFNIVKIKGDKQAEALFEFLATPENFRLEAGENVEWSRFLTGEAGKKGINFLTTSGEKDAEQAGSYLFNKQLKYGYTIRGHDHNHPTNNPHPSGTGADNGDIPFMKNMKNNGNVTPNAQFRIFTPGLSQKYNSYDENYRIPLPEFRIKARRGGN